MLLYFKTSLRTSVPGGRWTRTRTRQSASLPTLGPLDRVSLRSLRSFAAIPVATQKSNLSILSLLKINGGPSRNWLLLMTLSFPSRPASTSVSPGFSFPSTTARIT